MPSNCPLGWDHRNGLSPKLAPSPTLARIYTPPPWDFRRVGRARYGRIWMPWSDRCGRGVCGGQHTPRTAIATSMAHMVRSRLASSRAVPEDSVEGVAESRELTPTPNPTPTPALPAPAPAPAPVPAPAPAPAPPPTAPASSAQGHKHGTVHGKGQGLTPRWGERMGGGGATRPC